MKKVLFLVVVLSITATIAQAADVDFSAVTPAKNGRLDISYQVNGSENPRGIALKCTVLYGKVVTVDTSNIYTDPCFNTMIDYAYTAIDGGGSYTIGTGHPIADPCNPGVLSPTTDVDQFSICLGVLDQTGNQNAGLSAVSPVVAIPLTLSSDPCVVIKIDEDNLRGGVAGSQLSTNLPIYVTMTECYAGQANYAAWQASNKPACWCWSRQCEGDADGKKQGNPLSGFWYVGTNDIVLLANVWEVKDSPKGPGLKLDEACANIDHLKQGNPLAGYWQVGTNDIAILAQYWEKRTTDPLAPPGNCQPGNVLSPGGY